MSASSIRFDLWGSTPCQTLRRLTDCVFALQSTLRKAFVRQIAASFVLYRDRDIGRGHTLARANAALLLLLSSP
jgi:hypothetical protein